MIEVPKKAKKSWALVLMGGGARGLAHIGVLRVLEKNGLVPDIIAGTSMGAIVGGLFAAGLSGARLTEMLGGLSLDNDVDKPARRNLFKRPKNLFEYIMLSDYKNRFFSKMGLGKEDAIETYLKSCVGDVRIEDLPIKFVCNAVDLVSGKEVLFAEGSLAKALRATMSLPLVFAPVRMRGMLLLDGGVLNSAPVEAAEKAGAEVTVLVDIHRPIKKMSPEKLKNTFQVVQRMIDVAWAASFEERARHANFVLRVPVDLGTLDFSEPRRIALKGEKAAAANLQRIKEALGGLP
ncbi:MAG: patatin-like phospholipase family protein [Acidobacteria bacterium]|nr:patatin-like phospholipase family protein [Acidobacteriota bacterium]